MAAVAAARAAVILYYMFGRRASSKRRFLQVEISEEEACRRPAQAPATWIESMSTLSDTLCFTYSETIGKWPISDLIFSINYLMCRQGNLQVASVYAGSDCV
ncbi:putative mono-/di-acylglycerol lipase [Rosa chinensis]|uniref:Putative mono-/di-acylglycerol lipase n=1 Tax=Rosa chinensis TaxID=74649 RepID=A0A2P6S2L1_ROSCH|nr:putative mono-/di-acylglycerol lipase [Rosa chinensis]